MLDRARAWDGKGVRLPVHEIEEDLKGAVSAGDGDRVLLKAPTGSGKSTAVPGMLRDAGLKGRILVIEPRRMAARMLAGWVARQRGGSVGGEVGYAVRFDTRYGRESKIIYLTDGVFSAVDAGGSRVGRRRCRGLR